MVVLTMESLNIIEQSLKKIATTQDADGGIIFEHEGQVKTISATELGLYSQGVFLGYIGNTDAIANVATQQEADDPLSSAFVFRGAFAGSRLKNNKIAEEYVERQIKRQQEHDVRAKKAHEAIDLLEQELSDKYLGKDFNKHFYTTDK